MSMPEMPKWYGDNGQIVLCTERAKVMTKSMTELYQSAQDAFEDALLTGCGEAQLREYLKALIEAVENSYRKNRHIATVSVKMPFFMSTLFRRFLARYN